MSNQPVLIVGGGPVGLTLAIDLGQRGIACLLIDKRPEPSFLPKMERCHARTMEHFRRLGIAEAVRKIGYPVNSPLDSFLVTSLAEPAIARLSTLSVAEVRKQSEQTNDGPRTPRSRRDGSGCRTLTSSARSRRPGAPDCSRRRSGRARRPRRPPTGMRTRWRRSSSRRTVTPTSRSPTHGPRRGPWAGRRTPCHGDSASPPAGFIATTGSTSGTSWRRHRHRQPRSQAGARALGRLSATNLQGHRVRVVTLHARSGNVFLRRHSHH